MYCKNATHLEGKTTVVVVESRYLVVVKLKELTRAFRFSERVSPLRDSEGYD
jgi:hypothetical protein